MPTSERELLQLLLASADKILDRITMSHLGDTTDYSERYVRRMLQRTRIISAPLMAMTECNAGARTGTPTFSPREREKNNRNITFREVLEGNILYERPD